MKNKRNACPSCGNKTTVIQFSAYGACASCGSAWYYDKHNRRHQAELGAVIDEALYEFNGWTDDLRKAFGIDAPSIMPELCQFCRREKSTDGAYCATCAESVGWFDEEPRTFHHGGDSFRVGICSMCSRQALINQHNLCPDCRDPKQDEASKRLSAEGEISDIDEQESEDDYRYG